MSKFDYSNLEKEFNITPSDNPSQDIDISNMRDMLPAISDQPDPDDILYKNIERANKILDKLEQSILLGEKPSATLIEAYGLILNSVTSASTSLSGNTFAKQKHEYNMKMVEVKEQEVEVKRIIAQSKLDGEVLTPKKQGKVMVMDRESMLRMIKEEQVEVQVKSHEEQENL